MMSFIPNTLTFERKQTEILIQTEGVFIQLIRSGAKTRTASGGYASTGPNVVLPSVRRYMSNQVREQFVTNAGEGVGAKMKQYLLGPYGDDIQQGDTFVDPTSGKMFRIQYVHDDLSVETRAEIEPVT